MLCAHLTACLSCFSLLCLHGALTCPLPPYTHISHHPLVRTTPGERYIFNFDNAWLDTKNGTSRTVAPSAYQEHLPAGGAADPAGGSGGLDRSPTMPRAGEGKANYLLEIATAHGPEGTMADGQVMVDIIGSNDHTGATASSSPTYP